MARRKGAKIVSFLMAALMGLTAVPTSAFANTTSDSISSVSADTGTVAVNVNDGGSVTVRVADGSGSYVTDQTVSKSGDSYHVRDNASQVESTVESKSEYPIVLEEEVGSVVEVSVAADDSYSVASYKVLSDSGSVLSSQDVTGSKSYEGTLTVSEDLQVINVEFAEDVADADSDNGAVLGNLDKSDASEGGEESSLGNGTTSWDFSSGRLVVLASEDNVIRESDNVIAQYDDIYLLQYENSEACEAAFNYYTGVADAVEPDRTVVAADSEDEKNESSEVVVTEEENPIAALSLAEDSEAVSESGIIALLDTGVDEGSNVVDRVSVIGEELKSDNTHGQEMLEAILSQNPDAKVLSVRVLDDEGRGTISSIIAGIEYAISQDVDYINMSLYSESSLATTVVEKEIQKAVEAGIVVIGAAGNRGESVEGYVPGCVEEAYIIGAADENGKIREESNYGSTVDYYVNAESTSLATALFTGYVSKNGLDAVPVDGFIFDPNQTESPDVDGDTWISRSKEEIDKMVGMESTNSFQVAVTQTIQGGGTYTWEGASGAYMTTPSGQQVFCILPWSKTPVGHTVTFNDYAINENSDANLQLMAKLIYYGYMGSGNILGTGVDAQAITHFALSQIWMVNMGNNYGAGLSWATSGGSTLSSNGQAKVNNFINQVKGLPAVQGTLHLASYYLASGEAYQDLAYGSFEPVETPPVPDSPRITVKKVDQNGKAVSGAQFTVYGYNGSSYSTAISTKTTDSSGVVVFDNLNVSYTRNGLFLVKETKTPDGYTAGTTYLNDADKKDFEQYGGRLFYVTRLGGDCVAYRDTNALKILYEASDARLVWDSDGYFISDVFGKGNQSNVETCWWNSNGQSQKWYPDANLATGWYRSAVSSNDYTSLSGGTASVTNLCAHTYSNKSTGIKGISNISYSLYVYTQLFSYKTSDGRVTVTVFNLWREGYSYMFRLTNNTSGTLKVGLPTWTSDGNQSDLVWIGNRDISGNSYYDWTAEADQFDNLARLVSHLYINDVNTGAINPLTAEYYDSIIENQKPPSAKVTLKKASADTSFTSGNSNYSVAGAEFGVYSDSDCKTSVGTLTTGTDGTSNTLTLEAGTYYVKETKAPKGFKLDTTVHTVTLTDNENRTLTIEDEPIPARIDLVKVSANPDLVEDNANYSLQGAVYGIYTNSGCTDLVERMTTDASGKTSSSELPLGTYYVKEITASQGYDVDQTVYTVDLTTAGSTETIVTKTVTSSEVPHADPVTVLLEKVDADRSDGSAAEGATLEGAQFEVKFYDERMSTDPAKSGYEPIRTWVFESKKEGAGYGVRYLNSYKVSGDELYTDDGGAPSLPYGTVTIQEIKAPDGYHLNDEVFVVKIGENFQVGPVYQVPEIPNNSIEFNIVKVQAGTTYKIPGVVFEHTRPDGTTERATTDNSGAISFKGLTVGKHTIKEVATVDGFALNTQTITFTVADDGTINVTSSPTVTDTNGTYTIRTDAEGNVTATIENKPAPFDLHIYKENNHDFALQGAEFTLYSDSGCTKVVAVGTTDSAGNLTFNDLIVGNTYYLKETKAPVGYRIPVNDDGSDIVWTVRAESYPTEGTFNFYVNNTPYTTSSNGNYNVSGTVANRVANMTIINEVGLKLPTTGSSGMIILLGVGMALVGISVIFGRKRRPTV